LLAVAVFGAMLNGAFRSGLSRKLDVISLPPAVRVEIERQRSKLAAIETKGKRAQQAIDESFVAAYRAILWVSVAPAIARPVSAASFISKETASWAGRREVVSIRYIDLTVHEQCRRALRMVRMSEVFLTSFTSITGLTAGVLSAR
jgi:hypothetical protein